MKRLSLLLALILVGSLLAGEEERTEVFAPFVSRLKATAGETGITLTWRRSPDVSSPLAIYRHTEAIDESNFSAAQLIAKLDPEVEAYSDTPPDTQAYFYAVLLEDNRQGLYQLFIPFRNKTLAGIAVASLPPEEELAAQITEIDTRVADDSILISFQVSKSNRELLLFRSQEPIRELAGLPSYPVRLEVGSRSYRDYPIQGIDYYYAVLDAGLFAVGKAEVTPGNNSSLNPVQLPLSPERIGLPEAGSLRPAPLPKLLIPSEVDRGRELSPSAPFRLPRPVDELAPATARAIEQILASVPTPASPEMKIQTLPVDRVAASQGDDYTLQNILKEWLLKGELPEAERRLINYLALHRSQEAEARAHFYLAQIYYFQEKYRQAFLEFLMAQDEYYREVQPWLAACFSRLS